METLERQIFLSYGRQDVNVARRLFNDLCRYGFDVWFDLERLRGGRAWQSVIRTEIRRSTAFIALISKSSLDKRGYVQAELREALDVLNECPPDDIFVFPVRVDECCPSSQRLSELHWIDLFPSYEYGLERLIRDLPIELAIKGETNLAQLQAEEHYKINDAPEGLVEIPAKKLWNRKGKSPVVISTPEEIVLRLLLHDGEANLDRLVLYSALSYSGTQETLDLLISRGLVKKKNTETVAIYSLAR